MYNRQTIDQDIARLRDMGRRRTAWRMLQEAAQRTLDMTEDFDDTMASHLTGITELQSDTGASGIVTDTDTRKELIEGIDENMKGKTHGLRTGFKLLDDNYLLRPDTLTVIAAFTSVGKSALALNIVHSVARQGVACAYYSLEMSRKELVSRMVSKEADLTASAIINKPLTKEKADKAKGVIRSGMGLPIYYDDRATVDFNRTMRSIRTMAKTRDVKLAVIDYLQIYAQVKDDEERSISYMARTAKNVAKELGIAVVLISQLNRSALHPSIKMLRGSGQIEESADNIVLIDRPDAYPDNKVTHYEGEFKNASIKGTAKLILAKGRGVGTGSMLVGFDGTHTQFMEIEKPADAGHYEEQTEGLPF
jgi:replicative DNA helicase